jgi:sugar phosphate isomerase/epimerase
MAPAHQRFRGAIDFLEHCHRLGANGVQVAFKADDLSQINAFRRKLEDYHMYFEGDLRLPRDASDLSRFESYVRAIKAAGAPVIRTALLPSRRYETFDSEAAFREFAAASWRSLTLGEPVLRKHRLCLAVENHKDWRIPELLDLIKRLGSEYVGICVDTGNSIALLEDPLAVVAAYAPYAFSTHLKDMAVREYEDGFLLSEVPLGAGFLDLPKIIDTLQRANPLIRFNLEMITRDPLRIPCLNKKYWATFPTLPASALASLLFQVRSHPPANRLPTVKELTPDQKLRLEDDHVIQSFVFGRSTLKL